MIHGKPMSVARVRCTMYDDKTTTSSSWSSTIHMVAIAVRFYRLVRQLKRRDAPTCRLWSLAVDRTPHSNALMNIQLWRLCTIITMKSESNQIKFHLLFVLTDVYTMIVVWNVFTFGVCGTVVCLFNFFSIYNLVCAQQSSVKHIYTKIWKEKKNKQISFWHVLNSTEQWIYVPQKTASADAFLHILINLLVFYVFGLSIGFWKIERIEINTVNGNLMIIIWFLLFQLQFFQIFVKFVVKKITEILKWKNKNTKMFAFFIQI